MVTSIKYLSNHLKKKQKTFLLAFHICHQTRFSASTTKKATKTIRGKEEKKYKQKGKIKENPK